jgi:surfeit locus 1 family protein
VKARTIVAVVAIVLMASVCVRLGFWQISRWHEKRAENTRRAAAMAAAPVRSGSDLLDASELPGLQLEVRGRYDERRQILLVGRSHDGSPGVHVVTPLRFDDGPGAILVDRGWVYASDAATADPYVYMEPGEQVVRGMADPLYRGAGGAAPSRVRQDSITVWRARWLDADSLAGRFPYALAPWVLKQLPGDGVPSTPARIVPQPLDEMMHVSYAVQWFLFATILLVGPLLVWRHGRRGRDPAELPGLHSSEDRT